MSTTRTIRYFAWWPTSLFWPRLPFRWLCWVTVEQEFDDHYDNYGWHSRRLISP